MGFLLREALRRLCVEIGWSYAVFWRAIGFQNRMHLVWEDGHYERASAVPPISGFEAMDLLLKERAALQNCRSDQLSGLGCEEEDKVDTLVNKMMVSQVHVVGDGIIGQAASTGNHQWILQDTLSGYGFLSKGSGEMNHQFIAGIQTVAIIPVLPHGVVQLGSTQMVMENIGFVNHVKSIFAQQECMPGALLSNIISQKALSQKIEVHASLEIPISTDQSGNVCTKKERLLPAITDGCNRQLHESAASSSVNQLSCSLYKQLSDKMPPSASEMPFASRQTMATTFQPTRLPIVKPIFHLNSQLENGPIGAQVIFSNADVRSNQQVSPHDSSSVSQYSVVTSGLSSCSLAFPEEQLLRMSRIGSWQSANHNELTLDNTKMPQLSSHGSLFPSFLKDSVIVSSFGRSESQNTGNDLRRSGGIPEIVRVQSANSRLGAPQLLNPTNHSNNSDMLLGDSQPSNPSINKNSQAVQTAGKRNQENDLFQALDVSSTESGVHGSFDGSLLGTLQGCCLSSSDPVQENQRHQNAICPGNDIHRAQHLQNIMGNDDSKSVLALSEKPSSIPVQSASGNDLFDALGLNYSTGHYHGTLDNGFVHRDDGNAYELVTDVSTCITQLDVDPVFDALNNEISCSGIFSEAKPDQLLDAVVSKINAVAKENSADDASCKTSLSKINSSSLHSISPIYGWLSSSEPMQSEFFSHSPVLIKTETAGSRSVKSVSMDKTEECSAMDGGFSSQISQWVENGQDMKSDSVSAAQCKRTDEIGKLNRKRPRPGESPRPRPKDRQMIQDRVKELREIVPNGAKCSIDALLEKTIKHMLFLQSVTKHADKLKDTGEPKIINKEGGLLLKDNFEGGATWAFEVGTQSMICPIIVEDLNPPRQMLVEMLCEERGFFLEIADLIRGLGLTILKGVMEARKDKVWARFAVEANRDVTRMEIFLSLVRLLEPTVESKLASQGVDNINMPHNMLHQSSIPATGLSDCLR